MAQLDFVTLAQFPDGNMSISNNYMSFLPFHPSGSISWKTINFAYSIISNGLLTFNVSIGLYSITGSTLTLVNSMSMGSTPNIAAQSRGYFSATATSATSNLTPQTWFLGFMVSTSNTLSAGVSLMGGSSLSLTHSSWPGAFIGGVMTATTSSAPASVATSDTTTVQADALNMPCIILSA